MKFMPHPVRVLTRHFPSSLNILNLTFGVEGVYGFSGSRIVSVTGFRAA